MKTDLVVYSFLRCPFAMRVRMTLHEKGIPFEVREEDLKNFSPQLRALHPEAKVPVLVDGDTVIYESAIITEYIEDSFPEQTPLLPRSPRERAQVRLWTYWCNQMFKPDLDRLKYGTSRFPENECIGISEKVKTHLAKLEQTLQKSLWLVGEQLTLADIHVFPFGRQLSRVNPTPPFLVDYPKLLDWIERLEKRPSFVKTMAKNR